MLDSILRTSRNTACLLTGAATRMAASFALTLYCAAELGLYGFGQFSVAIHYFELFLSLTATAAGILLTRDMARWQRSRGQLLCSAITWTLLLTFAAAAAMIGLCRLLQYSPLTTAAVAIAAAALLPAAVSAILEATFVALQRAEYVTAGIAVESGVRIVASLLLLQQGYGVLGLMWALLAVRCLLLLIYWICLRRVGTLRLQFNLRRCRRLVARWRVFAAENWMATIYTNLDVIMLSAMAGEAAVGLYSAAWKVVRLGTVVAKSYTTAVFPLLSRLHRESRDAFAQLHQHSLRLMLAISLAAIAAGMALTERIIEVLYPESFAAGAPVLRVLIWVLLIECLNPFLSHVLFAQQRQHRSLVVSAVSLALNAATTFWLIRSYGALGAAIGTVLSGLVATCCYSLFALSRDELAQLARFTARVAVAAAALGGVLFQFREMNWVGIGALSAGAYAALLLLVRAVRIEDLQTVKATLWARAST